MAVTNPIAAEGQLATSQGDVWAPTVTGTWSLELLNTNAATQTVDLYLQKSGGTSRHVRRVTLAQYESAEWKGIPLGNGDKIRALTTTATAVNYVVRGYQK